VSGYPNRTASIDTEPPSVSSASLGLERNVAAAEEKLKKAYEARRQ
jgi:hypothetical protein